DNAAWLRSLTYQEKLSDVDVDLCHGSPVRLEEVEYIFAPQQARECLPMWPELRPIPLIGHSHPRQVFALTPTTLHEPPPLPPPPDPRGGSTARALARGAGQEVTRQGGQGGPAARLRQPRQLPHLRPRGEALRVQADRVRHRDPRREGPARQAGAQLRPPPLH